MAHGITRGKFFPFPNEIADEWLRDMDGSVAKATVAVLRQTLGWHRTSLPISSRWLAKLAGMGDRTAIITLDKLVDLRLLSRGEVTQEGQIYHIVFDTPDVARTYLGGAKSAPPTDTSASEGVQNLHPNKNKLYSTTYCVPGGPLPLIEQFKQALVMAASSPASFAGKSASHPAKEGSKPLTTQQLFIGILREAWVVLFGQALEPEAAVLAKLIVLYGKGLPGAEWLLKEMFVLAANPPPGGPLRFLLDKGYGKGNYRRAGQQPAGPPTQRQEVQAPHAEELQPTGSRDDLDFDAA